MQVGDQQRAIVRRIEGAGEIGHEIETIHPDRVSSEEPHGFVDKFVGGFLEEGVIRFAINGFAADLKHHRHGEGRNRFERLVDDRPRMRLSSCASR